ncbi:hypothetical protein BDV18DRAFT_139908 [Aspergillus unguis]
MLLVQRWRCHEGLKYRMRYIASLLVVYITSARLAMTSSAKPRRYSSIPLHIDGHASPSYTLRYPVLRKVLRDTESA